MRTSQDGLQHLRDLYEEKEYFPCRFVAAKLVACPPERPEQRAEVRYILGNLDEIEGREGAALDHWAAALAERQTTGSVPTHEVYDLCVQAIRGLSAAPRIFFSYSSDDAGTATAIRDHIESRLNLTCIDFQRDFPAAGSVSGTIADALILASCVVVVWSQSYASSRYCRAELAAVGRRMQKGLLPHQFFIVSADDTPLPEGFRDWIRSDASRASAQRIARRISETIQWTGGIARPSRSSRPPQVASEEATSKRSRRNNRRPARETRKA